MREKIRKKTTINSIYVTTGSLFFLLLFIAFPPRDVAAEFRCQAEIRYRWIPLVIDANSNGHAGPIKKEEKKGEKETPLPEAGKEGREVFWSMASASGATQDESKLKLKDVSIEERARADAACKEAHENQTQCFANKYAQTASALQVMGFSQRKELEKKIVADCNQASGSCQGSAISEPECQEIKAAEPTPAAEAPKGKDAKKK